jgi:hypothetical protein
MKADNDNGQKQSMLQRIGQWLRNLNHSRGAHDLTGWLGHGATELANVNIHGHAAPMYAHNISPQQQEAFDQHNENATERDAQHAQSKLDRAMQGMQERMQDKSQEQEQGMSR